MLAALDWFVGGLIDCYNFRLDPFGLGYVDLQHARVTVPPVALRPIEELADCAGLESWRCVCSKVLSHCMRQLGLGCCQAIQGPGHGLSFNFHWDWRSGQP